ncbi:MAG: lipoprotein, partial [Pseudomonadota bacterium]
MKKSIIILSLAASLAGCATAPPEQPHDICKIFEEKPDWYYDARDAASDKIIILFFIFLWIS